MDNVPSNHPTAETVQAYGLGRLDEISAEVVRKHLADCADCRSQMTKMTASGAESHAAASTGVTVAEDATVDSSLSPRMSSTGRVDATSDSANLPDETHLQSGTRVGYFGDYELLKVLGEGGMGIV